MGASEGWYPDPAGRYSHRWWDGGEWSSRVLERGTVYEDMAGAVAVEGSERLYCGICQTVQKSVDWNARCVRCAQPLANGYLATAPRWEYKGHQLIRAAQESFEHTLQKVDAAIEDGDRTSALRHLDSAIRFGTILRAIASSSRSKSEPPLALHALVDLHVQALRMLARQAPLFHPETFELVLLERFAAMYAPDGRDDLPADKYELLAWCAQRVAWAESEVPDINALLSSFADAYDWRPLRVALQAYGYGDSVDRTTLDRDEAAELLGVSLDATAVEIKKAYYREAAKHHPDVLGDVADDLRELAEEKMKAINAAYEVLSV